MTAHAQAPARDTLRVAPAWRARVSHAGDVLAMAHAGTVIHDTPRSVVAHAHAWDVDLMVKRSRRQERSRWLQVTSLWRAGEGVRGFDLLSDLFAAGLPVPEPVAALDRCANGLVTESYLVYRRIEGAACTCADAGEVAALLREMHAKGWIHGDPHVGNFLRSEGRLVIVDAVSARRRRSSLARAYDMVLLEKCCPGWSERGGSGADRGLWYGIASLACATMVAWRRLKARLRRRA